MLKLNDRPQTIDNAPPSRIAPAPLAPVLPIRAMENAGASTAGSVLGAGKQALFNIADGIARLGRVLSGPPMTERGWFRYAAIASKIQTHRAMAANWPQFPSK